MIATVKSRENFDFEGLKDMLLSVFSDEDTNGNNGPEFLTEAARKHFGFDPKDNGWYEGLPEDELERYTDDRYLEAILDEMKGKSEREIVAKAFEVYAGTVIGYYNEVSYDIAENDKKQITAVCFAAYAS